MPLLLSFAIQCWPSNWSTTPTLATIPQPLPYPPSHPFAGAVGHGGHYHSQSPEAFFANQLTPLRQFPCRGGGPRRPLPLPVSGSLLHAHPGSQSGHAQRPSRGQRWANGLGFGRACGCAVAVAERWGRVAMPQMVRQAHSSTPLLLHTWASACRPAAGGDPRARPGGLL